MHDQRFTRLKNQNIKQFYSDVYAFLQFLFLRDFQLLNLQVLSHSIYNAHFSYVSNICTRICEFLCTCNCVYLFIQPVRRLTDSLLSANFYILCLLIFIQMKSSKLQKILVIFQFAYIVNFETIRKFVWSDTRNDNIWRLYSTVDFIRCSLEQHYDYLSNREKMAVSIFNQRIKRKDLPKEEYKRKVKIPMKVMDR